MLKLIQELLKVRKNPWLYSMVILGFSMLGIITIITTKGVNYLVSRDFIVITVFAVSGIALSFWLRQKADNFDKAKEGLKKSEDDANQFYLNAKKAYEKCDCKNGYLYICEYERRKWIAKILKDGQVLRQKEIRD